MRLGWSSLVSTGDFGAALFFNVTHFEFAARPSGSAVESGHRCEDQDGRVHGVSRCRQAMVELHGVCEPGYYLPERGPRAETLEDSHVRVLQVARCPGVIERHAEPAVMLRSRRVAIAGIP